jgi:hypothetical protein
VNVSHILAELPVGLEPLTQGTWNLFFGPYTSAGWTNTTTGFTITAAASPAAANCHQSAENTCHLSFEMFTRSDASITTTIRCCPRAQDDPEDNPPQNAV